MPTNFESPPIVELVLGVQFSELKSITSGHLGWYWKQHLDSTWTHVANAPVIADQFESTERRWPSPAKVEFRLQESPILPRLQIGNKNEDRLIQIQSSRYHYNWKSRGENYPRFSAIKREFDQHLEGFMEFLKTAELGELALNQWEMTYVNSIPQGPLWTTAKNWHRIFPGLFADSTTIEELELDRIRCDLRFDLGHRLGGLHINCGVGTSDDTPSLIVQLTARGPIPSAKRPDLTDCFERGHEAAVRAFLQLSSSEAKQHWGIR